MGVDCCYFLERRLKGGLWKYEGKHDVDRDYDFFGLLADVRRSNNGLGLKGHPLPSDTTFELDAELECGFKTVKCFYLEDFRKFDWLQSWDDFEGPKRIEFLKKHLERDDYQGISYISRFPQIVDIVDSMLTYETKPRWIRAIFAFDG